MKLNYKLYANYGLAVSGWSAALAPVAVGN